MFLIKRRGWLPFALYVRSNQQGWVTWRKLFDIPGSRWLARKL